MSKNIGFATWFDENKSSWEKTLRKLWLQGKRKRLEIELTENLDRFFNRG